MIHRVVKTVVKRPLNRTHTSGDDRCPPRAAGRDDHRHRVVQISRFEIQGGRNLLVRGSRIPYKGVLTPLQSQTGQTPNPEPAMPTQVTIAVPPALPAAMTIGIEFAIERLKQACAPNPVYCARVL